MAVAGVALLGSVAASANPAPQALVAAEPAPVAVIQEEALHLEEALVKDRPAIDLNASAAEDLAVVPEKPPEVVALAETGSEPASDGHNYEVFAVSAAVTPGNYGMIGSQAAEESGGNLVSGSGGTDEHPLPFALALALIALVGLVPVSRRNV